MKKNKFWSVFFAFAALLLAAGCSKKQELHIYSWEDYIAPEVIWAFEKENNCRVRVDVFPSNEAMYAKLRAGAAGYDLIVPSSYMAILMNKLNMLEKLDHTFLPHVKRFYDKNYDHLSLDQKMEYSVPYFISFTGIGYDITKVKDFKPSWKMFERKDLRGKLSLLDDPREVIGCALLTLGYDGNSTNEEEIKKAVALARKWKRNIAKFGVDDSRNSLANGEFSLIQTYSGDLLQFAVDNPNLRFVIPMEGSSVTLDTLAILKNAPNKALAYKFIDFVYRTEQAVANMNEIYYRMPHTVAAGQVKREIRNNPVFNVPPAQFKNCTPLKDLGKYKVLYERAWDEIKR